MRYLPATEAQVASMLEAIGVPDMDALFATIPGDLRLNRDLDLPEPLAEEPLMMHLRTLAGRNASLCGPCCFLGGGV